MAVCQNIPYKAAVTLWSAIDDFSKFAPLDFEGVFAAACCRPLEQKRESQRLPLVSPPITANTKNNQDVQTALVQNRRQIRPAWLVVESARHQRQRVNDAKSALQTPAEQCPVASRYKNSGTAERLCGSDQRL